MERKRDINFLPLVKHVDILKIPKQGVPECSQCPGGGVLIGLGVIVLEKHTFNSEYMYMYTV